MGLPLFEFAPIPLWIEDFSAVKRHLDGLGIGDPVDLERRLREDPELVGRCAAMVRIVDVNPAAVTLHRATSKEELLASLDRVFTAESLPAFASELCQLVQGLSPVVSQGPVRTMDGETVHVGVHMTLDPDHPDWSRVYVATLDRTGEREALEQGLALQERLLQAQRAESLGVLAGGVAHDFNNILMAILGQVELARNELAPGSPVAARLEAVRASADRAKDLSRQMLAFSGHGHFQVEDIDLNELLRRSRRMLELTLPTGCRLVLRLAGTVPLVRGDVAQLQQLLVSLVANAHEALPGGQGTVEVGTGSFEVDATVLSTAHGLRAEDHRPTGTYAFLEVADEGSGMTADVLEHMFEPFFTTRFAGRGLGLAAVHGITRGHQGFLLVLSRPGHGTRVRVALPHEVTLRPEPRPPIQPPTSEPLSGSVLVVDDEEPVRRVLAAMLHHLGLEVLEAGDGIEALELVDACGDELDLVVLDVTMPRLDGCGTLRELRARHRDLPVVLMSGYDHGDLGIEGDVLPEAFLSKPFTRDQLAAVLGTAIGS